MEKTAKHRRSYCVVITSLKRMYMENVFNDVYGKCLKNTEVLINNFLLPSSKFGRVRAGREGHPIGLA